MVAGCCGVETGKEVIVTRRVGEPLLIHGVPVRVTWYGQNRVDFAVPSDVDVAKPEDLEFAAGWGDGWQERA